MNVGRNAAWALAGSVGSAVLGLAGSVLLARVLAPDDHGRIQAALAAGVLLVTLGNAGFVASTVQALGRAERRPARALGTGALGVTLAALVLAGLAWAVPASAWDRALFPGGAVLRPWLLALVVPTLWAAVVGAAARGLDRFALWTRMDVASRSARVALWAALALVGAVELHHLLVAAALAEGVALAVGAWGLRDLGWPRPQVGDLPGALRFGAPASLTAVAGQLHERLDLFLLALWRQDPVEVAVYAVAVGVVNRIRVVPLAVASALFPAVAAAERGEGIALARRALHTASLASLAAAGVLVLVAPFAVPWLFGAAYAEAVRPLWMLVPGTLAYGAYLVLARWFQGVDRQAPNLWALAVGTLANVGLNAWWIPRHGALGAAAASSVSYGLQAGVLWAVFRGARP